MQYISKLLGSNLCILDLPWVCFRFVIYRFVRYRCRCRFLPSKYFFWVSRTSILKTPSNNTVSLRIQSECGKIRTRKTANTDTSYTVYNATLEVKKWFPQKRKHSKTRLNKRNTPEDICCSPRHR